MEDDACLDRTFYRIVRTLCEGIDDVTSRFLKEENYKYEDDNAVHAADPITPPPTDHYLAFVFVHRHDQRTYFSRATRKPNAKGEMNGELHHRSARQKSTQEQDNGHT